MVLISALIREKKMTLLGVREEKYESFENKWFPNEDFPKSKTDTYSLIKLFLLIVKVSS